MPEALERLEKATEALEEAEEKVKETLASVASHAEERAASAMGIVEAIHSALEELASKASDEAFQSAFDGELPDRIDDAAKRIEENLKNAASTASSQLEELAQAVGNDLSEVLDEPMATFSVTMTQRIGEAARAFSDQLAHESRTFEDTVRGTVNPAIEATKHSVEGLISKMTDTLREEIMSIQRSGGGLASANQVLQPITDQVIAEVERIRDLAAGVGIRI